MITKARTCQVVVEIVTGRCSGALQVWAITLLASSILNVMYFIETRQNIGSHGYDKLAP